MNSWRGFCPKAGSQHGHKGIWDAQCPGCIKAVRQSSIKYPRKDKFTDKITLPVFSTTEKRGLCSLHLAQHHPKLQRIVHHRSRGYLPWKPVLLQRKGNAPLPPPPPLAAPAQAEPSHLPTPSSSIAHQGLSRFCSCYFGWVFLL